MAPAGAALAARGRGVLVAAVLLVATTVLLASLPGAAWSAIWPRAERVDGQSGAVRPMVPGDALLGPSRGSAANAIAFAGRFGARQPGDVSLYINEVYRLAPRVGLDPAIVVAQSALETDTWRTGYWANHRNPAGIGITYDGQSSFTWANGTDAARGHLVHLALYASGPIGASSPLYPYIGLDPRYQAAIDAGYDGRAGTIADLTGTWAADPFYDQKLTGRGNDMLYRYVIVSTRGSSNTTGAGLVTDMNPTTGWRTAGRGTAATASLTVDLGATRGIGRLRWLLGAPGVTDRMIVARSTNGASWTTVGTYGSGPTGQWQALNVSFATRYIRFTVENPNQSVVLGTITEVQLWPPATTAWPYQPDAAPPGPTSPSPSASASASPSASARPSATATSTIRPTATATATPGRPPRGNAPVRPPTATVGPPTATVQPPAATVGPPAATVPPPTATATATAQPSPTVRPTRPPRG